LANVAGRVGKREKVYGVFLVVKELLLNLEVLVLPGGIVVDQVGL
jgi:hypothetical protein